MTIFILVFISLMFILFHFQVLLNAKYLLIIDFLFSISLLIMIIKKQKYIKNLELENKKLRQGMLIMIVGYLCFIPGILFSHESYILEGMVGSLSMLFALIFLLFGALTVNAKRIV